MFDITSALKVLKEGHSIHRPDSDLRKTSYFIKKVNGKEQLFVRQTRLNSSDIVEEPSTFDWDDLTATNWGVVTPTSTPH